MKIRNFKNPHQMLLSLSNYMLDHKSDNVQIRISDNPFITQEKIYGYVTYFDLFESTFEKDCQWSILEKHVNGKRIAKYFSDDEYRRTWMNNIESYPYKYKEFHKQIEIYLVHGS